VPAVPFLTDSIRLFTAGERIVADTDVVYVVNPPRPLGDVVFPTGQVVACEPLRTMRPFAVTVPPGTYRLQAIDVTVTMCDGEVTYPQLGAVQLVVRDEPPVRWEEAVEGGGHPVDGGRTTIADLVAVQAMAEWDEQREDGYVGMLSYDGEPTNVVVDEASGANVIAVDSGGDGVFGTIIGYTADGDVASFATIVMY
jgi:hypothetical protein